MSTGVLLKRLTAKPSFPKNLLQKSQLYGLNLHACQMHHLMALTKFSIAQPHIRANSILTEPDPEVKARLILSGLPKYVQPRQLMWKVIPAWIWQEPCVSLCRLQQRRYRCSLTNDGHGERNKPPSQASPAGHAPIAQMPDCGAPSVSNFSHPPRSGGWSGLQKSLRGKDRACFLPLSKLGGKGKATPFPIPTVGAPNFIRLARRGS